MDGTQKRNNSMVIVLVGSALFLAMATFIGIILLTTRTSPAPAEVALQQPVVSANTVFVNNVPITTNPDPSKTIILVSELGLPQGGQAVFSTETPIPPTLGPTPTPLPTAAPTRDLNPIIFKEYVVVQGDSLYSIADAQNSSIELMAKHGIDVDDLVPGSPLSNPLPYANPAYCPNAIPYVVRDKDTVYRIAVQFNTTVDAIAAYNGLSADYRIEVTQVICIPG